MTYEELIVLIPSHSLEDFPTELGDRPAEGLLNAWAVLWHPALLATADAIPKWHRADDPPAICPNVLAVVPPACDSMVTSEWINEGKAAGMHIVSGVHERGPLIDAILEPLEEAPQIDPDLAADFVAFGHLHLQTELLTRHMRQFGNLEEERLQSDAVAAAKAAAAGDESAARTHLKHCFEMLLEAREKFYPVDCYLLDLCLAIPSLAGVPLAKLVADQTPVNLMATVEDLQQMLRAQPELQSRIRDRWGDQTFEIVGGEWAERCSTLLPLDAHVHELDRGRSALREMFGRTPSTWGRRRFGLTPLLPQLLKRSNYEGALHFVMDDGIYPDEEFAKLLWQGADGSTIASYSRIPIAGDSASAFLRFPVRMAESMDHDYVAGLVFARWPELRSPWLDDFRRGHRYTPALGQFVTFEKFFAETDLDGRMSEFKRGHYLSPFLVQAVAKREPGPVTRYVDADRRRRVFEATDFFTATASLITRGQVSARLDPSLESTLAEAGPDVSDNAESTALIDEQFSSARDNAADAVTLALLNGAPQAGGLLVVNSLSFARTVVVDWPTDFSVPPAGAPIIARHFTGDERQVVVETPPSGYVWLAALTDDAPLPAEGKTPTAVELVVRNEFMEVSLSDVTGGISQVRTYGRGGNRLSQQIGWRFPREKTVTTKVDDRTNTRKTWYTDMRLREQRVVCSSPACGAVETVGDLVDPTNNRLLGTYRQAVTLWRGRPYADVDIELGLEKTPEGDPWTNYVGCRFAWNDSSQTITRSSQETAETVGDEQRIESPNYIELAGDAHRTTILTGGLTFHRVIGPRMLDTLLVTEGEQQRRFRFAVAVDQNYPMAAALDWETDALAIPVEQGPPLPGPSASLFHISARNVQLRRILPLKIGDGDASPRGCILRLQETEGRNKTIGLGCFLSPASASQVDLDGHVLHSFKVEKGLAEVSIAPYELCDVELRFDAADS